MRLRRVVLAVVYLPLAWLFGGPVGLFAGLLFLGARVFLRMPRGLFWGLAVALTLTAPIVLIAQGLPGTAVVGPGFGRSHFAAHVVIGLAMAAAGLAALSELIEGPEVRGRDSVRRRLENLKPFEPPPPDDLPMT